MIAELAQVEIQNLMREAVQRGASDLHVTVGSPPTFRIHGQLLRIDTDPLEVAQTWEMAESLLTPLQREHLQSLGHCDFAFHLTGVGRFRVHCYRQRGAISLSARVISEQIPPFASLGIPNMLLELCTKQHGLLLITGPTGSGKSTTLASLIDWMNQRVNKRIITLEDPIEFWHHHNRCMIDQREIGSDTPTFAAGLRAALRQDPDVLFVGELRDLETMATAITASETGHLVLATLHAPDAPQAVDRLIDVFPPDQQRQIRVQLASVLLGIASQRLLPMAQGASRVACSELMVNTSAVAHLIRSDKTHQIRTTMQTSRTHGMQTMEMSVMERVQAGQISATQGEAFLSQWNRATHAEQSL